MLVHYGLNIVLTVGMWLAWYTIVSIQLNCTLAESCGAGVNYCAASGDMKRVQRLVSFQEAQGAGVFQGGRDVHGAVAMCQLRDLDAWAQGMGVAQFWLITC